MTRINVDYTQGYLTYREVKLIKGRLNGASCEESLTDETHELWDEHCPDDGYTLSTNQTHKGLTWLLDKWKSPSGRVRKNNPFALREQEILRDFKEFRLVDWYRTGSHPDFPHYMPVYRVISKECGSFDYIGFRGSVEII